ncbi:MAG: M14 family metallopeptidase [Elusimicrobiota bacterium]|nr:M14 family metallopeptidase [Elusimicrobiota bacterium]
MRSFALAVVVSSLAVAASALPDPRFDGTAGAPAPVAAADAAPAPSGAPADPRSWVTVAAGDAASRTAAATAGLAIEEIRPGEVSGFATDRALARLRAAGLAVRSARPLSARFGPLDFPRQDADFHNYGEAVAAMEGVAAAAPDLVSLFSIGKTVEGRDIWALRLNADEKGETPSAKPGIVFLGEHHAREHLSVEVPLRLVQRLVAERARPELARLLAKRDVYFIPMVNPDGAEFDLVGDRYHMHRKNTRQNPDGSRGVDLNRNYAFRWGGQGASSDPGDDTYHGPAPFSEPETQAVKAFVEARPNLTTLLSYHTFSELVLYPWGGTDESISDPVALAAFKNMAQEMAGMTGYRAMQSSDLYVATGDTCDWAWAERGIFAFTFELTPKSMWNGGFYPGAAAIATTVQANWRPLLYLIDLADDPRRAARGVAAVSGAKAGGRLAK